VKSEIATPEKLDEEIEQSDADMLPVENSRTSTSSVIKKRRKRGFRFGIKKKKSSKKPAVVKKAPATKSKSVEPKPVHKLDLTESTRAPKKQKDIGKRGPNPGAGAERSLRPRNKGGKGKGDDQGTKIAPITLPKSPKFG
jgi:hypothetical protein